MGSLKNLESGKSKLLLLVYIRKKGRIIEMLKRPQKL